MTIRDRILVMVILAMIGAVAILITVWVANGSEYEDAWFYVFSIWLVLYAAIEAYSQWKKGKVK
jgi:hypothetical protein